MCVCVCVFNACNLVLSASVSVELIGIQAWALFAIAAIGSAVGIVAIPLIAVLSLPLQRLLVPLLCQVSQQDASLVHHDQLRRLGHILRGQVDGGALLGRSNAMIIAQVCEIFRIVRW